METIWIPALELGGTKTVVAVGTAQGEVCEEMRFPTTTPVETLGQAVDWWSARGIRDAGGRLGVAAFGPVRVDRESRDYGVLLSTPKPGWSGFPLVGFLSERMHGWETVLDTDVNAAAWAELGRGAAVGCRDLAYITVGTGLGAGIITGGRLVHGALHPELGHLRVPRHPDDGFAGGCPYHGDCLEGLAAGPAIAARWQQEARDLPEGHPAWEMEAWYLAHGIIALCAVTSPELVVLGGGVSQARGLLGHVSTWVKQLSNGYYPQVERDGFVVPAGLGQQAGIVGALRLAGERGPSTSQGEGLGRRLSA
jgi:fructokinase